MATTGLSAKKIAKISESENHNVIDFIRNGQAQVVINTMDTNRQNVSDDGFIIRREAVEHGVPF